jgi:hypothetical protein
VDRNVKLLRFFVLLIFRIGIVFGLIALIAYGLWAFLYWLLM